jgi:hypothetical protein
MVLLLLQGRDCTISQLRSKLRNQQWTRLIVLASYNGTCSHLTATGCSQRVNNNKQLCIISNNNNRIWRALLSLSHASTSL